MKPTSGQLISSAIGAERDAIIKLANDKICFNYQELGKCDHSACYELFDLVKKIAARNFNER